MTSSASAGAQVIVNMIERPIRSDIGMLSGCR
ncbi:hypothetical protein FHS96_002758 [Sphingomonas zeicaulis]